MQYARENSAGRRNGFSRTTPIVKCPSCHKRNSKSSSGPFVLANQLSASAFYQRATGAVHSADVAGGGGAQVKSRRAFSAFT